MEQELNISFTDNWQILLPKWTLKFFSPCCNLQALDHLDCNYYSRDAQFFSHSIYKLTLFVPIFEQFSHSIYELANSLCTNFWANAWTCTNNTPLTKLHELFTNLLMTACIVISSGLFWFSGCVRSSPTFWLKLLTCVRECNTSQNFRLFVEVEVKLLGSKSRCKNGQICSSNSTQVKQILYSLLYRLKNISTLVHKLSNLYVRHAVYLTIACYN